MSDKTSHGSTRQRLDRKWLIRRVARRLRYRTVEDLVGRTVVIRSLGTLLSDVQGLLDNVCPGCTYRGPEQRCREGALAKYGLLDLCYDAPSHMGSAQGHPGLSLLRELALLQRLQDLPIAIPEDDAIFDIWDDLLEDTQRNETILKLFLEDEADRPPMADRMKWLRNPSLIPFPKTMKTADACVTNSESVWWCKHFYL